MIAGIDIGSRSMELVLMRDNTVVEQRTLPTTFDPLRQLERLLEGVKPETCVATGYGRELVREAGLPCEVHTVTEIKAHAAGMHYLQPEARTVLDIGGQDTKAISITETGKVRKFEMNDRCAAGTGKFLEYTAGVFQIPVEDFGAYALRGDNPPVINSMCTVFAETEATSLMARGARPEDIALGLHMAIARRTMNMLRRVGLTSPVAFAGGVARNPCMAELLRRDLTREQGELLVPDAPEMTGALGAALLA
ncbi:acyl-CoA dehydratase activase [Salidesulfovibrio brasiliensis]|uniref:acyl-CoA dehydratase activase n=1 Tax=Salidesulfovibrio brasiliensis TaxID=221711 RepID=UPI0006D07C33|nr:acyl-CoA dehydratase activase [Salidesulfovibrio brasiliensis]